ncbi:hypothetical protein PtrSN002B_006009 [Pyrenophora tritici-repentis]|uniref:Uncharacterized protein n=2 Tax=Pyrenophora tritici-repentis TaxID=45151 RepID=A0A2W1GNA7_9PLEO|nr:uncharacterized protein PTRG_02544 [Pyrenophora tritici-repentis Pt-1C-BFP]KAA8623409.1 hypothetical protein PtrV1_04715 [Pyrenophora tritici-repentis]EDU45067.1 predicted protein [Pyrenophora tritici-repentis Pt-1C-BFP]KAF7452416.1 hypothetical protein A1F99_041940 [Pyrenophora tritici-repentis]KAG9386752.1 hypothetical protein A1F94_003502 [Pyrenophora tritici-repentis]KAI0582310.1 hypothetical protein Alg130_06199 [Pyrenophora tritici-repentis]
MSTRESRSKLSSENVQKSLKNIHDKFKKPNEVSGNSLDASMEPQSEPTLQRLCRNWMLLFDDKEDDLLAEARVERLRCAYSRADLTLDWNNIARRYTEERFKLKFAGFVAVRRWHRNCKLYADYCKKHDIVILPVT